MAKINVTLDAEVTIAGHGVADATATFANPGSIVWMVIPAATQWRTVITNSYTTDNTWKSSTVKIGMSLTNVTTTSVTIGTKAIYMIVFYE